MCHVCLPPFVFTDCVVCCAMQNCGIAFTSARLIPMGSHPRVADKRGGTYDLFGPVRHLLNAS